MAPLPGGQQVLTTGHATVFFNYSHYFGRPGAGGGGGGGTAYGTPTALSPLGYPGGLGSFGPAGRLGTTAPIGALHR